MMKKLKKFLDTMIEEEIDYDLVDPVLYNYVMKEIDDEGIVLYKGDVFQFDSYRNFFDDLVCEVERFRNVKDITDA